MADPTPYTYKALFLSPEDSRNSKNFGYKYLMEHQDEFVDISDSAYEIQTYDRGTTQMVYGGKVYMIHKDFVFLEKAERVFLMITFDSAIDLYDESAETETSTEKPVIIVNHPLDYLDQNKKVDEESKGESNEDPVEEVKESVESTE